MKKNSTNNHYQCVPQLEALVVLMGELLKQISTNKKSGQVAREKAAVILVNGGMARDRAARLLGMQKKKVIEAIKTTKL